MYARRLLYNMPRRTTSISLIVHRSTFALLSLIPCFPLFFSYPFLLCNMHISSFLASSLAFLHCVNAAPTISDSVLSKRCTNSATDRSCWGDYDLSTNYYEEAPDTGVVVEYWFELVNSTSSLDGVERNTLTVNGTFPGPTIIANWGDTVRK